MILKTKAEKLKEVELYPRYKKYFVRICDMILDVRSKRDMDTKNFKSGIDVFNWWISRERIKKVDFDGGIFEL